MTAEHVKQVQEFINLLRRNNLTELEIERQGFRIRVRHEVGGRAGITSLAETPVSVSQTVPHSIAESVSTEEDTSGLVTITSPIVGTFYRSPSPDADPYVEEGDYVRKGQVLCIVEAMKLMNEIESETDGRIVKILAESTKPVEYGQPLFLIDPKARP
ncbi:MAG: acetyl-CoA carboxylase biotin carboxyl carrier protein [Nitrospira sp.]|nr:acetyl-CoA carboxylase biotin carboxyl carrier protein [Nitrospira sp.]